MGCDIHMFVETKKENKWELFKEEHFSLSEFDKEYYKRQKGASPFSWRSYDMFGILAGVRRSGIIPIKLPTYELPEDVSFDIKNHYEAWGYDAHTVSYLTVRELYEFDYDKDYKTLTNKRKVLFEKQQEFTFEKMYDTYSDLLSGYDSLFFIHLQELTEIGNLDDVRIVFWFDN